MIKKAISIMSVVLVVFLCSSFNVFATVVTSEETYTSSTSYLDGDLTADVTAFIGRPTIVAHDYNFVSDRTYYGTSNQPFPANPYNWQSQSYMQFYDVPVTISVTFTNKADYYAYAGNTFVAITPNFTFNYIPDAYYFDTESDGTVLYRVTSGGQFQFRLTDQNMVYSGRLAIGRGGTYTLSYTIHFLYLYELGVLTSSNVHVSGTNFNQAGNYISITSITLDAPQTWLLSSNVDAYSNPNITTWQIKEVAQNIYRLLYNHLFESYGNVQNDSSTVDTNSSSLETQSNTNHQTELSYFNQTNTALNNSGISNYQFDNEQIGGIGSVSNDFTSVWNSLGSWTSVYIFSLTLSLGLAIIRHVRPIKRSNEE